MKRIVIFYSLSGNTREAAEVIAKGTDADILELKTVKSIPKSDAGKCARLIQE